MNIRDLPITEHFRPRPVASRFARRATTFTPMPPPTDEEKRDAILVLGEGYFSDVPEHDPLYREAERIFEEGSR